jgi:hypothetical protein
VPVVVNALRQSGVSPKVAAAAVTGVVLYVLSLIIPVDQTVEQLVNVLGAVLAGALAGPGKVEVDPATLGPVGTTRTSRLSSDAGYGLVECLVALVVVIVLAIVLLKLVDALA